MRKWDGMTLVFIHSKLRQLPAMFKADRLNRQLAPSDGEYINSQEEKSMGDKRTPLR
jgi:hypothetical protein